VSVNGGDEYENYLKKFLESLNLALSLPWLLRDWKVPKSLSLTIRFCFSSCLMVSSIVFNIFSDNVFGRLYSLDMIFVICWRFMPGVYFLVSLCCSI